MIVVDSSALIAILFDEPEKEEFESVLAGGEDFSRTDIQVWR